MSNDLAVDMTVSDDGVFSGLGEDLCFRLQGAIFVVSKVGGMDLGTTWWCMRQNTWSGQVPVNFPKLMAVRLQSIDVYELRSSINHLYYFRKTGDQRNVIESCNREL